MVELRTKPAAKGTLVQRRVIGIFGNKQHGKDTFGHLLSDELRCLDKRTKVFALADPLKEAAIKLLGMPREVAFGEGLTTHQRERARETWKRYGRNGRQWLQWVGTELGRDLIDANLWIDRVVDTVLDDDQGSHAFIITDCRFHNERVNLGEKLEGVLIPFVKVRIHRPTVSVDLGHRSESEVASMPDTLFDFVIVNDKGFDELRVKARDLAMTLVEGDGA